VTNCFCVPHKETEEQVEAEITYALDVYELNRRVNSSESIIGKEKKKPRQQQQTSSNKCFSQFLSLGWWATGNEVTNHSSVIHEYYTRECNNPIHLTLDTSLQGGKMGLKAYVCVSLGVPSGVKGCMFTPIKVDTACYEPEVVALKLSQKTIGTRSRQVEPMMDLAQIAEASEKLLALLNQVLQYVEDVLNEKQQPDNAVGRALLDLIHSVPNMTHDQFATMFNSNVKDLLMVVTLSQLIKTQLSLNERLTMLSTT
jgi:translation initiation factor 3 subunit F